MLNTVLTFKLIIDAQHDRLRDFAVFHNRTWRPPISCVTLFHLVCAHYNLDFVPCRLSNWYSSATWLFGAFCVKVDKSRLPARQVLYSSSWRLLKCLIYGSLGWALLEVGVQASSNALMGGCPTRPPIYPHTITNSSSSGILGGIIVLNAFARVVGNSWGAQKRMCWNADWSKDNAVLPTLTKDPRSSSRTAN